MRHTIVIILGLICCSSAHAQLNFTAGYRAAWTEPETFNQIIDIYNEGGNILPDIKSLRYMNGIDLGVRYLTEGVTWELGWKNKRKTVRPDGIGGNKDNNTITPVIHSFSLGAHPTFGAVSIGGTIDYNLLKIRKQFEFGAIPEVQTTSANAWSSHFSLSFNFSNGGVVGFTLQPYIQVYWSEYNLDPFYESLNGEVPENEAYRGKFNTIGFALLVNNGRQPVRRRNR